MEAASRDRDSDHCPAAAAASLPRVLDQASARPTGGRPPVSAEIEALVSQMIAANRLWGALRIHAELGRSSTQAPRSPSVYFFAQRASACWSALIA